MHLLTYEMPYVWTIRLNKQLSCLVHAFTYLWVPYFRTIRLIKQLSCLVHAFTYLWHVLYLDHTSKQTTILFSSCVYPLMRCHISGSYVCLVHAFTYLWHAIYTSKQTTVLFMSCVYLLINANGNIAFFANNTDSGET